MNSTEAKIALLSYCRFARQMHYVCTEASMPGGSLADVVASDGKNLIEYEIKVSMSDLKSDKKKPKHLIYDPTPIAWDGNIGTKSKLRFEIKTDIENDPYSHIRPPKFFIFVEGNRLTWQGFASLEEAKKYVEEDYGAVAGGPNMLYYVVPEMLWDKHQDKIIESLADVYGVITFRDANYGSLTVQRKAKKLHKNEVSPSKLRTIVARMSSEIASLTSIYYNHVQNMTSYGRMLEMKLDLKETQECGD